MTETMSDATQAMVYEELGRLGDDELKRFLKSAENIDAIAHQGGLDVVFGVTHDLLNVVQITAVRRGIIAEGEPRSDDTTHAERVQQDGAAVIAHYREWHRLATEQLALQNKTPLAYGGVAFESAYNNAGACIRAFDALTAERDTLREALDSIKRTITKADANELVLDVLGKIAMIATEADTGLRFAPVYHFVDSGNVRVELTDTLSAVLGTDDSEVQP